MQVFGNRLIFSLTSRFRPFVLGAIVLFTIAEIVAFSPSSLEEVDSSLEEDPADLVGDHNEVTLATGIPKDVVPDYSIDGFDYVSTQAGEKQWKLLAKRAYLYNSNKLVHARTVNAFLYDSEDQITTITGKEAKYFMNQRDLEVFGSVVTRFPDGFVIESEYLRYLPKEKRIEIPLQYEVKGYGKQPDGQYLSFRSRGLDYVMGDAQIYLPDYVRLEMTKDTGNRVESKDRTVIESDHCMIYRNKQLAHFTMRANRPLKEKFVHITQPNLDVKSRTSDLNYGDYDQLVKYMVAYDDVLIKEENKDDGSLRYATSGRADFETKRNVIILTHFPQVYQNNDTVTGDVIILHRDTDIVEVEHSNAFSEGTESHE